MEYMAGEFKSRRKSSSRTASVAAPGSAWAPLTSEMTRYRSLLLTFKFP